MVMKINIQNWKFEFESQYFFDILNWVCEEETYYKNRRIKYVRLDWILDKNKDYELRKNMKN
jgi:hypothetical protein